MSFTATAPREASDAAVTKLTDLSVEALADLLGLQVDKAGKWLQVARSISDGSYPPWMEEWFGDLETSDFLRRSSVEELMQLSVEDVEDLRRTGRFHRRFPHLKPEQPTNDATRIRYLQDLLADEVEFEARYPAAYEVLFGNTAAISGLPMPSFDIRVLRNYPRPSVLPAGWSGAWKQAQDIGDAFSFTFERRTEGPANVDQDFARLDLGYVRGLLLAILGREEYAERVATELHHEAVRERLRAPSSSLVRLTDLRLATAPELRNLAELEKASLRSLESLARPITRNMVLKWKQELLRKDTVSANSSADEETEIARVSFVAAAILLFLDLDVPGVEDASSPVIARRTCDLAENIHKLSRHLDRRAADMEKLLAYRSEGRPSAHGQRLREALVAYRMGKEASDVARDLGINPYSPSPSEPGGADFGGTKHWKKSLAEKLARAGEVEQEKCPLAAAVFANRDKPRVAFKSRVAFRVYEEWCRLGPEEPPWGNVGGRIGVNASTYFGLEVTRAYVQLGSCLRRGLVPDPTHPDFRI